MRENDAVWHPVFLTTAQSLTLAAVADALIPRTASPGALDAMVPRTIDARLAIESVRTSQAFLSSLEGIDAESRSQCGAGFADLSDVVRVELLHRISVAGHASFPHFTRLKNWVTGAYFSSEAGLSALGGRRGNSGRDFEGCSHPPNTH